ncbi:MAG: nucleoside hydrolase [Thermomicrobiales bacterium]
MPPTPIMLDVDTGIDDSLAIALACASPEIDVVAVSTVAGNTSIEHATRNTLDVLAFLGATGVPVYRGASRPLARPLVTAAHVHGSNGLGGATLPTAQRAVEAAKGPATMVRLAQQMAGELTLVCVGPLTNLAIALNVEPDLPSLVKSVVIMGGAYRVQGNMTKAAEFNYFVDPEAAAQVFTAPFPEIIALGLDVTHQAPIPPEWWRAASGRRTPAQDLFHRAFRESFEVNSDRTHYMHDAMAVAAVIDRSIIETERRVVAVDGGVDERGASRLTSAPPLTDVAVNADVTRFSSMMQELLALL